MKIQIKLAVFACFLFFTACATLSVSHHRLYHWKGHTQAQLQNQFGEPDQKIGSPKGRRLWVYKYGSGWRTNLHSSKPHNPSRHHPACIAAFQVNSHGIITDAVANGHDCPLAEDGEPIH